MLIESNINTPKPVPKSIVSGNPIMTACSTVEVYQYHYDSTLDEVFAKQGVDFSRYTSVMIDPVSVWYPDEAEIMYPSIPGRVFKGRVTRVVPNLAEGQMQASGSLIGTAQAFQSVGRIPVLIEVLDDMSEFNLPTGSRAQVAIYSDHFHHLAIMRRFLLRMSSWENYLYLDH